MSITDNHAERLRAGTPAEEVLADLERLARARIAEVLAGKPLVFRLTHGEVEDDGEAAALQLVRDTAGHALLFVQGGSDWCDYYLDPQCPTTLLAMDGVCRERGRSWWRWTTDGARPRLEVVPS